MGKPDARERARAKRLWDSYGLTIEQWETVNTAQKGVCWICSRPSKSGKRLNSDHRHLDGMFRGLLCSVCNRLLGRIERAYPKETNIIHIVGMIFAYLKDPPASGILGKSIFGYAGRIGTKKHRQFIKKAKEKQNKMAV
ncbi:MAG TPA: endonuclease domain-containing protein [Candidatus Angelobacter sp.]|nr:endonuclease domain-containing protein [Candidatus Angelobacter sp.]